MIIDLIETIKNVPLRLKSLFTLVTGGSLIIWSIASVDKSHAHTWFEKNIPAFWSIFGISACLILIFFTKWFKNSGIQREEDYYDK